MTEAEQRRAEAIWTYRISQEKVLKSLVEKGIFTQEHADYMGSAMYRGCFSERHSVDKHQILTHRHSKRATS